METQNHIQILRREFGKRQELNPRYSMRSFAASIDMSQGALSEILAKKRVPSVKIIKRIWEKLNLDPQDLDLMLVGIGSKDGSSANSGEVDTYRFKQVNLDVEYYRTIADWYHSAIMELTFVEDFDSSPKWIAKRLGISEVEASLAVNRMIELKILEFKDGKLTKKQELTTTADKNVSTSALRRWQRQLLTKSIESLERDPIERRNHSSMTFAIDPDLLPEAKNRIQRFMDELTVFLESGKRKEVYQLQVSLYPFKENESENTHETQN